MSMWLCTSSLVAESGTGVQCTLFMEEMLSGEREEGMRMGQGRELNKNMLSGGSVSA